MQKEVYIGAITLSVCACAGIWAAPLGHVTIVFLSVVGVPALRAWDDEKTNDALVMFASIAKQHLRRLGGYLVSNASVKPSMHAIP